MLDPRWYWRNDKLHSRDTLDNTAHQNEPTLHETHRHKLTLASPALPQSSASFVNNSPELSKQLCHRLSRHIRQHIQPNNKRMSTQLTCTINGILQHWYDSLAPIQSKSFRGKVLKRISKTFFSLSTLRKLGCSILSRNQLHCSVEPICI